MGRLNGESSSYAHEILSGRNIGEEPSEAFPDFYSKFFPDMQISAPLRVVKHFRDQLDRALEASERTGRDPERTLIQRMMNNFAFKVTTWNRWHPENRLCPTDIILGQPSIQAGTNEDLIVDFDETVERLGLFDSYKSTLNPVSILNLDEEDGESIYKITEKYGWVGKHTPVATNKVLLPVFVDMMGRGWNNWTLAG